MPSAPATTSPTSSPSDAFDFLDNLDSPVLPNPAMAKQTYRKFEPSAQDESPIRDVSPARGRHPLYFDLETIPDESRMHLFGLDPLPTVGPRTPAAEMMDAAELRTASVDEVKQVLRSKRPDDEYLAAVEAAERADSDKRKGNRKGIFEALDELRNESATIAAASAERQKKMAITPEMCRIVSLAWAIGGDPVSAIVVGQKTPDGRGEYTELDLLDRFWSLATTCSPVIGFNVLNFDLPVVFVRSMLLGIKSSRRFDMRPWGTDVVDVMAARYPKVKAEGLKSLAQMMGIEVPAGDMEGSQVAALYAAGKFDELAHYNRSDVQIIRELHRRYRGFFCA